MKSLVFAISMFVSAVSLASPGSHVHTEAPANSADRVQLQPESTAVVTAGSVIYKFKVIDSKTKKSLSDKDLQESHTKKLHMISYDPSLREFNHEHPTFDGKVWSTELKFTVNGKYFVWAQGTLNNGTEFSAKTRAEVTGGPAAWPVVALGDHRKGSDRGTVIELEPKQIQAKKMVMANFKVTRDDGLDPQLAPYLGAFAHVIAVSPNGEDLIHVHPMEGETPTTGMLHATFPSTGDYRIWIQLIDRSEVKTIPLSVSVK